MESLEHYAHRVHTVLREVQRLCHALPAHMVHRLSFDLLVSAQAALQGRIAAELV